MSYPVSWAKGRVRPTTMNIMLARIPPGRQQGGTVNRQARRSERGAMKIIGLLVAGALFLNELPAAGAALEPIKPPDRLVLRSRSSFSLRELSIDLGPKGLVGLRDCAASDSFGGCKTLWKTSQRMLTSDER